MNAKQLAAEKAVQYIQPGMTVGLGTGSTAFFAIEKIGEMVRQGLHIQAVASSLASTDQARHNGITMVGMTEIGHIDITIDGADEVDEKGNLIKGGGGALTREKILAYNSTQVIIIVDESKLSVSLQRFPVAVEVVPFGYNLALAHLQKLGCGASIRQKDGGFFKTDNGNWIVDCSFGKIEDPDYLNAAINLIPGVVESGLFSNKMVHKIIVGYPDGRVEEKQPGN